MGLFNSLLGARECRTPRVPIRRALESKSCVQNDLISKPAADQLDADGEALSIKPAGK
jgi:hypothetical protein